MHTGTTAGGLATRIGSGCLLMVSSHVGHDSQLGSNIAAGKNLWYWEVGVGCTSAAPTATQHRIDLAVGTSGSNKIVIDNKVYVLVASPGLGNAGSGLFRATCRAAPGDGVYARMQSSGAAQSMTAIAYAVGG